MMSEWGTLVFERDIRAEIDLELPGIYEWRIAGSGSYVGKSRKLKRRLREYPNNLRKLGLGLPYRAGKPELFRLVHREMLLAHSEGRKVVFTVIENCPLDQLTERERFWINCRGTLNR